MLLLLGHDFDSPDGDPFHDVDPYDLVGLDVEAPCSADRVCADHPDVKLDCLQT